MADRGRVRRHEFLCGARGGQRRLQMNRLVEELVTNQDHQGEETQLEMAADGGNGLSLSLTVKEAWPVCQIDQKRHSLHANKSARRRCGLRVRVKINWFLCPLASV